MHEVKRKVLLLYYDQFGYHTDTFMYARYLDRRKYDIQYFCFDQGLTKVEIDDIKVHYQELFPNRIKSFLLYFLSLKRFLLKEKFDIIFQVDSKFTSIIRLMNPFQPMILDIRSGDLSLNPFKLWFGNAKITFVTYLYKNVSVISSGLRDRLGLPLSAVVIPLGGQRQNTNVKSFDSIRLLYIGSLDGRNIHETVTGLGIFIQNVSPGMPISYDIVGFGKSDALSMLNEAVDKARLSDKVVFHGRKKIDELFPFFEKCNIGVAYLPKTKAYDCQPVTKLFECVLAGMPVIATNTLENEIAILPGCGELCSDNPASFAEALNRLINNSNTYDSEKIKESYSGSEWKNIVSDILEPFIDRLIDGRTSGNKELKN